MQTTPMLVTSALVATMIILLKPLLSPKPQTPIMILSHYSQIKTSVKMAFLITLIPLTLFISQGTETVLILFEWLTLPNSEVHISFKMDYYSILFVPIALFVTWTILEFAGEYMTLKQNTIMFFNYLLIFLITMMILVTANNLLLLFIGWEGVGIMSFLLISWWYGRADANTAALQAVLYNRVGDIGMIFSIAWIALNSNTWDLQQLHFLPPEGMTMPLLGLVLAAAGKSAQFGLHPWLPAAMEGPTPVSALLHSSTMVVAGIFMLIRMSPLLELNPTVLTVCLCLGALTSLFAATCALTQNDIKKIVAFSTSSQLGLMMVAIGLNQPQLAFLHICMHAFFKAMLFMCSGAIIHHLNNEQDIRKMGGMNTLTPVTSRCFAIGNLALAGTPYLAGFYSKDAIIEALSTSHLNAWALTLTVLATSFTAVYSLRLIYFVSIGQPRVLSTFPPKENTPLVKALKHLVWGSITAGVMFALYTPTLKTPVMTMPPLLKLSALLVSVLGFLMALELAKQTNKQIKKTPILPLHHFSNMLGFYPRIVHNLLSKLNLSYAQTIANQITDLAWLEKLGPGIVRSSNKFMVELISNIQRGKVLTYLIFFIMTMALALIIVFLSYSP